MSMTMTQKILAAHSGLKEVIPGQLLEVSVDMAMGNDITTPVAINEFEKAGFKKIYDKSKVALVMDHFVPNKDIKSAQQVKQCRCFAEKYDIGNFFDVGASGIEHVILPEMGLVKAGDIVIGADSHTCTYGALGAFSTGVGSTDLAAAIASGKTWFKVPSAIKIILKGKLSKWVSGKDIILYIIGKIGVDGAIYKSLEFFGDGISGLSMSDRFTICNMAIEAGAKNGIFPVDDITVEYLNGRITGKPEIFNADADAQYDSTLEIDLSSLKPVVAFPHLPENTHFIDEIGENEIKIHQSVIGSCTNGRIEDLRVAAEVLKGRKIAKGVRCIVIPGSREVYLEALREGLIETFILSGAVVSTPTCGPCLGGHMGVLAQGESAISTTNRNFVGRMGHPESYVYLSNPAVAAASAVTGYISTPDKL